MSDQDLRTLKFINSELLGRKRPTIEIISDDPADQQPPPVCMAFLSTETTEDREQVLLECSELLNALELNDVTLKKQFHKSYLDFSFNHALPPQMKALDASQPWIMYWIACSLRLMDEEWLSQVVQRRMAEKLLKCSLENGPFCGGPGQDPHLVCTYAAVNALALCGNIDDCWGRINKKEIYEWLLSLKSSNNGFKTGTVVGECDSRSTYCALSVASMLNILTPELSEGVEQFLLDCQTYEGGFGACPHEDEAHGGYTFCAVAGLMILKGLHKCKVDSLLEWCSGRQTNGEKGFSGRSNKLVDGCYSYWVGAVNTILEIHGYDPSVDKTALQDYILKCCQSTERPGLRDKPGKSPDYYHTAYVLMGFSLTEHSYNTTDSSTAISVKPGTNHSQLNAVNPVYGIPIHDLDQFLKFMST
ncbi:LADA_0C02696g1_1 [Lachancea dasiensis]|uniref:Protein farnesyltransferase subunit beta n=1 Tax=Lachancea dasiensis TaxID=1072105 RepID=A0A1G4IY01_9SACH|nr:LADA_0C02696g1_1 [Lachancea dasiensis]